MTVTELHAWAVDRRRADDPELRDAAKAVLEVLNERADLVTLDYMTLREDLRIARHAVEAYKHELARLRALLAPGAAPWDEPPVQLAQQACNARAVEDVEGVS